MATKQTAWFFLPFYLILVFKTAGARRFWSLTGIVAGVFIGANLPFIVMNGKLWFDSVMAPMTDRMFPLGVGFITVLTSGVIDVRSQMLFAGLELLAGVICIGWYWKYGKQYPETGPILAVLPIFFAWRSLWTYFFYVGIIVLASVMLNEKTLNRLLISSLRSNIPLGREKDRTRTLAATPCI